MANADFNPGKNNIAGNVDAEMDDTVAEQVWGTMKILDAATAKPRVGTAYELEFWRDGNCGRMQLFAHRKLSNKELGDSIRVILSKLEPSSIILTVPCEVNKRSCVLVHLEAFHGTGKVSVYRFLDGKPEFTTGRFSPFGRLLWAPNETPISARNGKVSLSHIVGDPVRPWNMPAPTASTETVGTEAELAQQHPAAKVPADVTASAKTILHKAIAPVAEHPTSANSIALKSGDGSVENK